MTGIGRTDDVARRSASYTRQVLRVVTVVLAGCGRIGFDGFGDASLDAPASADLGALPCEVDQVIVAGLPDSDELRLVYSNGYPHLIDVFHVSTTAHEVRAYRLEQRDGGLGAVDLGVIFSAMDIAGLAVESDGTNNIVIVADSVARVTHVRRYDASFTLLSDVIVGAFTFGIPPYARSDAGALVVGTAAGTVVVQRLDSSFAPQGPPVTLATGAGASAITATGSDFFVGWLATGGLCRFARIDISGAILAGPIATDPGTQCAYPLATGFASGRVAYLAHDTVDPMLTGYAGTFNATLTSATVPGLLGPSKSYAPQLVIGGDTARIPVFAVDSLRLLELTSSGTITQVGAEIPAAQFEGALRLVELGDGTSLLAWTDGGRLLLRRLCR